LEELDQKNQKLIENVKHFVDQYLAGKNMPISFPIDLQGTEFQIRVWQELLKIPYGQTLSYQQMAHQIEKPRATRAVGTAIGKNPLCLVVPCHRVISANGSLGVFSGGLKIKQRLLKIEQGE
jgi:O-6-methylguanine DNA methyltransferase